MAGRVLGMEDALGNEQQVPAKCPVPSFGSGHLLRSRTVASWASPHCTGTRGTHGVLRKRLLH